MSESKLQNVLSKKFVPVCAIGASAGGVTALQQLLRLLPMNLGLAYVVIIHLSPDQPSSLSEILSVCTRMPVLKIDEAPILSPNSVYVIPPDRELVIVGDSVTARPFTEPRGQRAPIDMFFRSIAAARGDGIAVVLSGAGADGAGGVRAVKEAGGVIMVQEPAEAGFPSMPQNAIASGVADFIAPIARLVERLAEVAQSKEAVRSLDMDGGANDLRRIVAFLRARLGHDFSGYKRATVMRRVVRRMQVCRTNTLAEYSDYLMTTPEEAKELFSDLLISVTSFFRDAHAFAALQRHAVKTMLSNNDPEREDGIRAWVVGCATGEEAYSIAILLHEEASRRTLQPRVQIFATDLDEGALATAREGRYPRGIEVDVSEERLARFFVDEGTHYRVRKELRESVLFATHSVIREPPFLRLDLVSCRNLLIYLERTLQQQLCSIFHYALKPGGFLFFGSAETADVATDQFAPLDRDARIYSARSHAALTLPVLPQFAAPERMTSSVSLPVRMRTERTDVPAALHVEALERTAPASALVDDEQNVIHLSPSAGRFILLSAGPVPTQLPAMVRPELRLDLQLALTRALQSKQPTLTHPIATALDGGQHVVSMHVMPVPGEAHTGAQALIMFLDGGQAADGEGSDTAADSSPGEVRRLLGELKAAQEALLASRSGHEATIQDLRATNEELQSTNEEYRSTAEELETSKEELQSINEELHTVNAELKSKLGSISLAHSDLQNLTTATDIGTLFLDAELRIKMFTPPIVELFNVTKADIGRLVTDFTHRLNYDDIAEDARRVVASLAPVEVEVQSKSARWYVMRLRPYRTVEDRIDGTVVSFVDITERRQAEARLRESEEHYRVLFDSIDEGFCTIELLLDNQGSARDYRFLTVNSAFERQTGLADAVGRTVRDMVPGLEESWFEIYGRIAMTGEAARFENRADSLGRWYDVYACRVGRPEEMRLAVLFRDVLARKRTEAAQRESEARFRALATAGSYLTYRMSPDWRIMHELDGRNVLVDTPAPMQGWADTYILPEDRPAVFAVIANAIQSKSLFELEHRVRRADGSVGWVLSRAVPMLDPEGEIDEWFGAGTDVTERRMSQELLRESEERLRQFGEASLDILWIRDAETLQWTYLTPAFEGIYGLSREEALTGDNYRGWQDLIVPEDRDHADRAISRVSAGERVTFQYRIRRPLDGQVRWMRNTDFPMYDKAGKVVQIGGVGHDITPLKAIEAALAGSETRLRTLTEGIPQLVWRCCSKGLWTWSSPQWMAFTGQTQSESLGFGWLEVVHPDDHAGAMRAWQDAETHGKLDVEYRVRRASDRAWMWHRSRSVPVREAGPEGAEGPITEWLGTTTDIDDLKRLQGEQQMLVAELQHRTRNLLSVVRNVTRRSIGPSPERDEFDARLAAIGRVQGFLSRSPFYSVPLADVVEAELHAVGDGASDRVSIAGPAVTLPGESVQAVALALHELATNAVKYGAISQPQARLSVMWEVVSDGDGKRLVIDWRESGVAMPERPLTRRGYGSELITRALPYQLHAKTELEFASDGVKCRVVLPGSAFTDASKEDAV